MKQIWLLLLLFRISSMELIAQEDNSKTTVFDSIDLTISNAIKLDSSYYPPCILPLEPEAKIPFFTQNLTTIVFDSGCHAKGAKKDLENGKPIIWFPGGFSGCDFSSQADREFQKKYHVQFVSPACCRFGDEEPEAYNEVIFTHLDKKYGKGWRDELRIDAEGFRAPRTNVFTQKLLLDFPSMQIGNPENSSETDYQNPDAESSVWWYILPTSGFALLLGLYFIKRKKN